MGVKAALEDLKELINILIIHGKKEELLKLENELNFICNKEQPKVREIKKLHRKLLMILNEE